MRVRLVKEFPPNKADIKRIVREGASEDDKKPHKCLLRRLEQSCYLAKDHPEQFLNAEQRLLAQYQNDGLVLFLGSGVSCGSAIPDWGKLIGKVLHEIGIDKDKVEKAGLKQPMTQFDLVAYLKGRKEFVKNLYKCLYEGLNDKVKDLLTQMSKDYIKPPNWDGWKTLCEELGKNKTLKEVGDLLILETNGQEEPKRNPKIHAVITMNADNLLELYCLTKTLGKRLLINVDRASVGDHLDKISVYHLHGTLDARGENIMREPYPCGSLDKEKLQKIDDDLLPDLVFRESEYYESIANPTRFVNHTPQSYLQRHNVLFIGTSLDDLNIRRWLYSSFQERVQQRTRYLRELYCEKYKAAECEAKLESKRHFWLRLIDKNDGTDEDKPREWVNVIMREMGVQVIWCDKLGEDDYDEVRNVIRKLQEGGNADEVSMLRDT